jgi:NAD(P)-dependent dehydrogenase (short-subunit alcohol dehydrogenase family)
VNFCHVLGCCRAFVPSMVGRMGLPAANADVILLLASDRSRFVVGQVIPTDGGRWTNRPRNP